MKLSMGVSCGLTGQLYVQIHRNINYHVFYCCWCTGHGNFGSVLKGEYTKLNGEKIPVAVKKLKSEEMNNPKVHVECTIVCTWEEGRGRDYMYMYYWRRGGRGG